MSDNSEQNRRGQTTSTCTAISKNRVPNFVAEGNAVKSDLKGDTRWTRDVSTDSSVNVVFPAAPQQTLAASVTPSVSKYYGPAMTDGVEMWKWRTVLYQECTDRGSHSGCAENLRSSGTLRCVIGRWRPTFRRVVIFIRGLLETLGTLYECKSFIIGGDGVQVCACINSSSAIFNRSTQNLVLADYFWKVTGQFSCRP